MIGALILGALAGWIASKVMNVEGGLLRNIIIGVVGACLFIWIGRKVLR